MSDDALLVRAATLADMPRVTAIYRHAVMEGTATYELDPPDENEMASRFRTLESGGFPWLVAESGGDILGYAYAGPFRARPAYRFIVEDSIYLAPDAQGLGTGRRLLAALIDSVREKGFRQLVAVIGDGHEKSASVKVHERLGFVHSGVLKGSGYKHGRWLDTVFMQLPLNGGDEIAPDPDSFPERRFRSGQGL